MLVAKRIWKEKISKADFKDILGFLNHQDGIAYLADGKNLFTGTKVSLVSVLFLQGSSLIYTQSFSFLG